MDTKTPIWKTLNQRLHPAGLQVLGGLGEAGSTLFLVGPDGARFWAIFQATPEHQDNSADPIDRYSTRILTDIALGFGAEAIFPFGGPPYQPFRSWALASGRCFRSPVQLLVHAELGLFTSFRGALKLSGLHPLPPPLPNPCHSCQTKPCLLACPASALTSENYNVALCHDFLNTESGAGCMAQGCAVRRACPIGQAERPEAQSAFHMQYFHKKGLK